MYRTLLAAALVLGLGACTQYHDAEWYAANPDAANKRLMECQKLIAEGKISPFGDSAASEDCRNAAQGVAQQVMGGIGL